MVERLLLARRVEERLGCSRRSIDRYVARGWLTPIGDGWRRFREHEVEALRALLARGTAARKSPVCAGARENRAKPAKPRHSACFTRNETAPNPDTATGCCIDAATQNVVLLARQGEVRMPADVVVDSEPVLRALRDLAAAHAPRAVAEALNKTAFDVLEAEKAHVLDIFQFAGPSTSRFISGSFRFNRATQSKLSVEIFPLRASEEILRDHTRGERYTADDVSKLEQDRELAIPIAVRRTRSGRVGKKMTPQAITGVGGRGFVTKGAILQRVGKHRYPLRVAYVLSRAARNKPVFRFYAVARTTVAKVFAEKARRAIEKELLSRAGVTIRRHA